MSTARPYMTISDHYRQQILTGELEPGAQLPSNREMANRWNVATATISRALSQLMVEGYIRTSTRGTFVSDEPKVTASSRDRLARVRHHRTSLMEHETCTVTVADLRIPPLYVADLFDLEPGDQLVRREFVAGRGKVRTMYCGVYYPAAFAAVVPDLLNKAPGRNAGLLAKVLDATGRTIAHARDDMHAREANAREASHLGVPVGSPILAMVHRWSDDQGVIEYGEVCIPPQFTIGYEYAPTV